MQVWQWWEQDSLVNWEGRKVKQGCGRNSVIFERNLWLGTFSSGGGSRRIAECWKCPVSVYYCCWKHFRVTMSKVGEQIGWQVI